MSRWGRAAGADLAEDSDRPAVLDFVPDLGVLAWPEDGRAATRRAEAKASLLADAPRDVLVAGPRPLAVPLPLAAVFFLAIRKETFCTGDAGRVINRSSTPV
jgi:hypothetical protein